MQKFIFHSYSVNNTYNSNSKIDSRNFEFKSAGEVSEDLYLTYTSHIPTGLFALENKYGMEVCITNVGGRIVSILVPDKNGLMRDVVLGFDTLKGYIDYEQRHSNSHGALVGRFANRIQDGVFSLDGKTYKLPQNNGSNCLHGGFYGWAFQTFEVVKHNKNVLHLKLKSPDGDMGFPGNVDFSVLYRLDDDNSLHVSYEATTDKPTPINVTNHAYFNLSGDHSKTVLGDKLFINSRFMTPLNDKTCPNGDIVRIKKRGPFDFYFGNMFGSKAFCDGKQIGEDINAADEQIAMGHGYDHNFILQDKKKTKRARLPFYEDLPICARLSNENSGIALEVYTSEPGVQFYDSVDLDGKLVGKNNIPLKSNSGACLETQHFPDGPNKDHFPSTILRPGEKFRSKTIYKFS